MALEIVMDAERRICPGRRVAGKSQLALPEIVLEIRSRATVAAFKTAHGFSMSVQSKKRQSTLDLPLSRQRAALTKRRISIRYTPPSGPARSQLATRGLPVVQRIALNAGSAESIYSH